MLRIGCLGVPCYDYKDTEPKLGPKSFGFYVGFKVVGFRA